MATVLVSRERRRGGLSRSACADCHPSERRNTQTHDAGHASSSIYALLPTRPAKLQGKGRKNLSKRFEFVLELDPYVALQG